MQSLERIAVPKVTPGEIIDDATVWRGVDFPADRNWARALRPEMWEEIEAATRRVMARGIAPKDITPADFPLERTAPLLRELYRDIECGPGFALLTGFPVDGYGDAEIVTAYCGFCCHFGQITVQNREGEYILDVTDKSKAYDRQSRGYHSNAHLGFHTDGTNTVVLLCREVAAEGGESMLVSGPAVYNEILRTHPEYLDVLCRGFYHHRRNQRGPGDPPVTPYRTPVFGFFDGLFHLAYAGPSILYCESEGVTITDHEKAALAYFDSVVERPDMALKMELRKGDMQFVNNFLLLHSRTAYRDAGTRKRHLLRLWLDDRESVRLGPGKMDWYIPEHSRFTREGRLAELSG